MNEEGSLPEFSCKCLNVRLSSRKPQGDPPHVISESDYEPLYVGDDGIAVRHNHLTLRTRSTVAADSSTSESRLTQHTSLSCLVCHMAVYRVSQDVNHETQSKEGPILPSEEWAERDTLYSKTGWVEVHVGSSGCISADEIVRSIAAPSFSPYFSINVPDSTPSASASSTPTPRSPPKLSMPPASYLPSLPSLFPPPPFTPSHAVFQRLSATATAASDELRSHAEDKIADFVQQQIDHITAVEQELRKQVELLWRRFRSGVRMAEPEHQPNSLPAVNGIREREGSRRSSASGGTASTLYGSPVIRDFIPASLVRTRTLTPSVPRGPSALSASLSTSTFHHPAALQGETAGADLPPLHSPPPRGELSPSPPPYDSNPSSPNSSLSGPSASTLIDIVPGSFFRRNMNETQDAAATFRWYTLEAEKENEATARRQAAQIANKQTDTAVVEAMDGGHVGGGSKQKPPGEQSQEQKETSAAEGREQPVSADESNESNLNEQDKKTEGRKGKRKVTFDIKPAVVTIKRELNDEKEKARPARHDPDEGMIFELEDSNGELASPDQGFDTAGSPPENQDPQIILPLNEPVPEPSQRRFRNIHNAGLPESLLSLRPASLPAPSHIRPPIHQRTSVPDSLSASGDVKSTAELRSKGKQKARSDATPEHPLEPHEAEILRLVAADATSHRGAWVRGSNAWKIFERRRKGRPNSGTNSPAIAEEEEAREDGDSEEDGDVLGRLNDRQVDHNGPDLDAEWARFKPTNVVSSLPISMDPLSRLLASEGGLSLQPKSSLMNRQGSLVPPLPVLGQEDTSNKSSTALRKAAYDERDRSRAMDPGVLDFMVDADDDDEADALDPVVSTGEVSSSSRGREHALRILKARNEVPAAGMWRSLAT